MTEKRFLLNDSQIPGDQLYALVRSLRVPQECIGKTDRSLSLSSLR
jgi:hypothetical protein